MNTKARHKEIVTAAKYILADVDVANKYPFLELAKQLSIETGCHITTAKRNLAKAARLIRGEIVRDNWGGDRKSKTNDRR